MADALRIAIVGAESTGKTTLAAALAAHCADADRTRRVAWVAETLRDWCDRAGRTPRADEQAAIMREQHARIDAAAATHDVVVCDTTALMTAVYSRIVFGDGSLDAEAVALHASTDLTIVTAVDLPWVADGLQRDGEQVRAPVDAALRSLLLAHRLPWCVVGGSGAQRLRQAAAAVDPLLRARATVARRDGPFTRLAADDVAGAPAAWSCACCSVPEFERASMRGAAPRRAGDAGR